jgi:hypothetical protein
MAGKKEEVAEATEVKEEVAEAKKTTKKADPDWEPVKIQLFKDNDKYKDPVFAAINGKSWLIERGKEVTVPACVKKVLDWQIAEDQRNSETE